MLYVIFKYAFKVISKVIQTRPKRKQTDRQSYANLDRHSQRTPLTHSYDCHSLSRQNTEVDSCRNEYAPSSLHHRFYHRVTRNSTHSNCHALTQTRFVSLSTNKIVLRSYNFQVTLFPFCCLSER